MYAGRQEIIKSQNNRRAALNFSFFFSTLRTEASVRGFKATPMRADPPWGPSGPHFRLRLISPSIIPTRFNRPLIGMRRIVPRYGASFVANTLSDVWKSQTEKGMKHESFSLLLIHWRRLESQSNFFVFALIHAGLPSGEEGQIVLKEDLNEVPSYILLHLLF